MAVILFDTSTTLAAGATFQSGAAGNGGSTETGLGSGMIRDMTSVQDSNRFGVVVNSDQAGTVYIDGSFDRTIWRQQGSVAVAANTPTDLDIPVRYRYYRVRYVNGGTPTGAGNFAIHSSIRSGQ